MIHQRLIKKFKLTPDDLRAIFTCEDTDNPHYKVRKNFERRINSRVLDGIARRVRTSHMYRAVDMAWDSQPIQTWQLPLLLYAQGKIKVEALAQQLQGHACAQEFLRKDGDKLTVDLPRLYEVSINLIRSYTTRRLAAQCARFSNLWPYFNYEPRGTDDVAKLRGEMTSQRVEVMSDAYNYRHFWPQTYRHMLLYGHNVAFPRCGWDVKNGWRLKNPSDLNNDEWESFVEREGVDFVSPHPSRVYWDTAHPLANINTDTGPTYIGYWDVVRYREILDAEGYFNVDKVCYGDQWVQLLQKENGYFAYYFDPKIIAPDSLPEMVTDNSRSAAIGRYSGTTRDAGCLLTQHFEKINPKREGMSDLNMDVWIRLTAAGDDTIVGAEVLPSRPAVYGGHNENDDREVNISMAMELMPFQDQLTNLLSQMLMTIKTGMMQIWAIDQDALEPAMKEYIEKEMKGNSLYTEPKAFFYSGSKLRNLGLQSPDANPRAFLNIIQAEVTQSIEVCMNAMVRLLNLADRVIVVSPNEVGQPNERTISAREVTEIAQTTNSVQSFISDGIDEQRAAVKKLLFESLICCSTQTFKLAPLNRYTKETIRKAGFRVEGLDMIPDNVPIDTTVVGDVSALIYDYYFDTRDGAERASNAQVAEVLSRLLGQVLQVPELASAVGKKRIFEMLNEVFRLSGSGYDLKMEDGENESMPNGEDRIAALEKTVQQLVSMMGAGPTSPAGDQQGLPPALQDPMLEQPAPPSLPPGENLQPVLAG